jgi:hypothetical protein
MSEQQQYEYMLLGRLQMDCEYFINTAPHLKHLWAGNVKDQISKMKEIYGILNDKPEWLTMEQIEQYETQMKKIQGEIEKNEAKIEQRKIQARLDYLRGEIVAERISYGEIAELESLKEHIDGDVLLLEWAGVEEPKRT